VLAKPVGALEPAKQKDGRKWNKGSMGGTGAVSRVQKGMKRRNGRGRRDFKYSRETMDTDTRRLCIGGGSVMR
jgi:hypothetical protein